MHPYFYSLKKQFFASLILFCLPLLGKSQELQMNSNRTTGDTTYVTTPAKIFSRQAMDGKAGEQVFLSFFKQKNLKSVAIMVQAGKLGIAPVNESDQLRIQLKNGDTLLLNAVTIDLRENDIVNYGSDFICFYRLNETDIQAIKKNPVALINLKHATESFDYTLMGLPVERIKKAASLIF
jgi:hypothetical protein